MKPFTFNVQQNNGCWEIATTYARNIKQAISNVCNFYYCDPSQVYPA